MCDMWWEESVVTSAEVSEIEVRSGFRVEACLDGEGDYVVCALCVGKCDSATLSHTKYQLLQ